jgi:hypothetical protein
MNPRAVTLLHCEFASLATGNLFTEATRPTKHPTPWAAADDPMMPGDCVRQ